MKQTKSMRKRKAMLCAMVSSALLLGVPGISQAEEQAEYSFEQVVVTATKTPVKEFEANANITVITREEIEKKHYRDLSEALRDVPGVSISNYGNGVGYEQSNSLKINGSGQIVVLIDGVRANINGSTFSTFSASGFNALDNVERIEILKGSAATLYGSDAKGGVINIITRKADGNKTILTVTGGSYSKETYSLVNQGKSGDYSWGVTVKKDILGNYTDAHGLEVPSHLNATTNTFKINKKINEASDVTLSYDQYKADYLYSGTNLNLNRRYYGTADNYNWKMIYNYRFSGNAQNQLVFFKNHNDTKYDTWLMNLETVGVQDQFTQKLGKNHTVTSGFDIYQDKIIDYSDGYTAYKDKKITNRAIYVQDEWSITKKWKLTSGLRHDNHSLYGNHNTPSINLGYKQNDNTNYYVAYKEFFVSPNQYQLYSPYGNQNLKPETGHTVEAGINHKFDNTLTGTFHVFTRKSNDVIGFSYTDWKYHNINEETAHGWDMQLNKKLSDRFNTYVGYTHTVVDPSASQTENVNGTIPKGYWNIGFNYQQEKYDVALQGRGIIDKPGPKAATASFPASTYWVWDMALNYKVAKDTKAFVKVNNIFNQYYAEMSNVKWGQPGEWYTSPGRNYQIGVQYQF